MSDRYLYGKDFQRSFIALEDNEPVKLPSGQTPAIYIFTSQPSRAAAAAGTGAVQTISSWTQDSAEPYAFRYTVTAISDPTTTATDTNEQTYWEAINYVTKSSGQTQTSIRSFILYRGFQPSGLPVVKPEDLTNVYPAIADYLTEDQLVAMTDNCLEEMIRDLESRGVDYGRFHDQRKLKLSLAYKVIAESSLSQVKTPDDKFDYRYKVFTQKYSESLSGIQLPYDSDGDGEADQTITAKPNYRVILV